VLRKFATIYAALIAGDPDSSVTAMLRQRV
jgi:hypothetical protein